MVKQLMLVRHAEARPAERGERDFDRPLTNSGLIDASRLGKYLAQQNLRPNLIITSSAARAQATAQHVAEQLQYNTAHIKAHEELYEATIRQWMVVLNEANPEHELLMLIGHNPTISYFAEYLTQDTIGPVPPGCLIQLQVHAEKWAAVSRGTATLHNHLAPNQLTLS